MFWAVVSVYTGGETAEIIYSTFRMSGVLFRKARTIIL